MVQARSRQCGDEFEEVDARARSEAGAGDRPLGGRSIWMDEASQRTGPQPAIRASSAKAGHPTGTERGQMNALPSTQLSILNCLSMSRAIVNEVVGVGSVSRTVNGELS